MCGIAGVLSRSRVSRGMVQAMIAPIVHRGPDDEGVWVDEDAGIAVGHRRLAVVDLSPHGHQPMESRDGRFVICYNGEIYNHAELRRYLEDVDGAPSGGWVGQSDTETLVEAIAKLGLRRSLEKSTGMFAFAVWDRRRRRLFLVRDRFGEKPLYYGWVGRDFVFGSELKAIRAHPGFNNEIDRRALNAFLARTYVPAPLSIYRRIFKLEPGCILEVSGSAANSPMNQCPEEQAPGVGLKLERYWSYADVMREGLEKPITDNREALDRLERTLADAIARQCVADVPVGAFLSGGIDSSTVVALYQKYSDRPVRTFTIGFEEAGFNEATDAKAVAKRLGTIHDEQYVSVDQTREVIPLLSSMYDEPFADSSQIPTYLISKFARQHVTVALTGDGGDELFGGYHRYMYAPQLWQKIRRVPRPVRAMGGRACDALPDAVWSAAGRALSRSRPNLGWRLRKAIAIAANARSFDDVYCSFLDEWAFMSSPVLDSSQPPAVQLNFAPGAPDCLRMMYCDALSYLPDDILCKVDRAAMSVSLETRVPFLDHHVAELAARIPLDMKFRGSQGKQILRTLLARELPRELFERPKRGFGIPVGQWIKGPLRPWAEELVDPARLENEGWFDVAAVRRRWTDHLSGARDCTFSLWAVLMFQSWSDAQRNCRGAS